eukprot:2144258-Amphidinium_carterae.5
MARNSKIKYHPTSGYKHAQSTIKRFYDNFEIYNWDSDSNINKPIDENGRPTLRQYLSISLHYAENFYDRMRQQKLGYLTRQGASDDEVQIHEAALRSKQLIELYIMLREETLQQWPREGTIPPSYIDDGSIPKHSYYNFHDTIEYAVNDFLNIYVYNHTTYANPVPRGNTHDIKTTTRLRRISTRHNRGTGWYTRRDTDKMYQIYGDDTMRPTRHPIQIGKYMEIKTFYKQLLTDPIGDKVDYKRTHFHDFSIITTSYYFNEKYCINIIEHVQGYVQEG